MLMSSLDSLSEIVLGNVKVPSEKTEQIVPFLEEIKRRFGLPVAAVHDMGHGILAAVQRVFPGASRTLSVIFIFCAMPARISWRPTMTLSGSACASTA